MTWHMLAQPIPQNASLNAAHSWPVFALAATRYNTGQLDDSHYARCKKHHNADAIAEKNSAAAKLVIKPARTISSLVLAAVLISA